MKKYTIFSVFILLFAAFGCGNSNNDYERVNEIDCSLNNIDADYAGASITIDVSCSSEWTAFSNESWIDCKVIGSTDRKGTVDVLISDYTKKGEREGSIVIKSGMTRVTIPVKQSGKPADPVDPSITVPEGYELIWNDEFNTGDRPDSKWFYETGDNGWGNNELQSYVNCTQGDEQLAVVNDGIFSITAKKINNKVYSIRINTKESWKYGYFEARLKLPKGKGTWPAFWMMPANFTSWPADGEIDIMEEVGYNPNYVSSAIHCTAYNHSINTEKTKEVYLATAQSEFNVYALEWTEDYIKTFVNGKELLYFPNDKKGNQDTWPFDAPFYIKLNLAWGGNWGGAQGVDESALPAVYEIDYVRVFQKK